MIATQGLMAWAAAVGIAAGALVMIGAGQMDAPAAPAAARARAHWRFVAMDLRIDPRGQSLAAWQAQIKFAAAGVSIVGIEGGDSATAREGRDAEPPAPVGEWQPAVAAPAGANRAPFAEPPVYDARAIQNDRVILAAYSLAAAERLPTGLTRVARIHLQVPAGLDDEAAMAHELRVVAAGNAKAERIPVEMVLVRTAARGDR